MSGGHFEYRQYQIGYIVEDIEELILKNGSKEKDNFGFDAHYDFPKEVIEKFLEARKQMAIAAVYTQRIDWLVSGDDGEESFLTRLKEDLEEVEEVFKKFKLEAVAN